MSDRITEIKVEDLTLEHLWCSVEADGEVGQLIRFSRSPSTLTLGPAQAPKTVPVERYRSISVLDAPQPERKTFNFGAPE